MRKFTLFILLLVLSFHIFAVETVTTPLKQIGYGELTSKLSVKADGSVFATGSSDGAAYLWDRESGDLSRSFVGHSATVTCVKISPNGVILATGSEDETVKLWSIATGECLHTLEGHEGPIASLAFTRNSNSVASGDLGGSSATVKIWSIENGNEIHSLEPRWFREAGSLAFNSTGTRILVGSEGDNVAELWDLVMDTIIFEFENNDPSPGVTSVAFSNDDSEALIGSEDMTATVWNTQLGIRKEIYSLRVGASGKTIYDALYSANEEEIIAVTSNHIVTWNRDSKEKVESIAPAPISDLKCGVLVNNGNSILVASSMNSHGYSRNFITEFNFDSLGFVRTYHKHFSDITDIEFSSNGTELKIVDNNKISSTFNQNSDSCTFFERIDTRLISPDSSYAVAMYRGTSGSILVTDVETKDSIRVIDAHLNEGFSSIKAMAFLNNGYQLLTSGYEDTLIKMWDLSTGDSIGVFIGHASYCNDIKVSKDDLTFISAGYDSTVRLWDIATQSELMTYKPKDSTNYSFDNSVATASITPDSTILIGHYNFRGLVYFWDYNTGEALGFCKPSSRIKDYDISSDSKHLLLGLYDGKTLIYDIHNDSIVHEFVGQAGDIDKVAYSPDNKTMYTGSNLGTVLQWKIPETNPVPISKVFNKNSSSFGTITVKGNELILSSKKNVEKMSVELFSVNGKKVFKTEKRGEGVKQIKIKLPNDLASGIYLYSVKTKQISYNGRFQF